MRVIQGCEHRHPHWTGLIDYKPGLITVLNRDGLERATFEDYGHARDEYVRLLGHQEAASATRSSTDPTNGQGTDP